MRLDAANPVTRLLVAIAFAAVLVISIDPVSAGTALVLGAVLLPLAGARIRPAPAVPVLLAAPLAGVTIALYGAGGGRVLLQAGFAEVSERSLDLGLATLLRVLAIGLVGLGLLGGIDATRLADGLAQLLHLPSRFVLGALAAFRLLGLLGEDWRALELARRARGVADRGRVRRFTGQAFALLVLAVRRGSVLATAMEARGFGGPGGRTWARRSRLGVPDAVLVVVAGAVLGLAITAAVLAGTWQPGAVRA